jgi:hypothetical protein
VAAPGTWHSSSRASSPYRRGIVELVLVAALVVVVVLVLYSLVDDHLEDVRTGRTFLAAALAGH